ncbi:uncharacterized protein Z518_00266 [Rhinocladiella mackenziei CBS 650.93]|uniref:Aldehyde dehydrogenase domain-containing protein n=1 Tax=Rhinocladiella mackenziei CBS 650.93 TaxID=1442369 RepID=A0A0D2G3L5_9EURO|nr:uncharacterized protein Z518_00266 [Rhinocladiella mackenziei CBS 650.93]KIX09187.1 hypothetical protein Z518_00266 [Rhinocladiella mackenziei CBS 650.93]
MEHFHKSPDSEVLANVETLFISISVTTFLYMDIPHLAAFYRHYAGPADKIEGESFSIDDDMYKIVQHEPLRVYTGTASWNGSFLYVDWKIVLAFTGGNAIGIANISITGSAVSGIKVHENAVESNLKQMTFVLGGKSPAIVFKDADLDRALERRVEHDVTMPAQAGTSARPSFRDYLPKPDFPRLKHLSSCDAHTWGDLRIKEPFVADWMSLANGLISAPYQGITTDGVVQKGLFKLAGVNDDHGAPVQAMIDAVNNILLCASEQERRLICHDLDALQWRQWMNPEIYVFKNGVRLEEISDALAEKIHALMRASLSPSGYQRAIGCMKVNAFLGRLVNGRGVLNRDSYNFVLYGEMPPRRDRPWGWQLYGHHLCLNCTVLNTQMVLSPVFMGAEPNVIDDGGSDDGLLLFDTQEARGLALMQSLPQDLQCRIRVYDNLEDPNMPEWRFHRADQRHLGGAFQDNRVIPYEGVPVVEFPTWAQSAVENIIRISLDILPEKSLDQRMREILQHWSKTFFSWIGSFSDVDAFYYKIHSPVIMIEFDHHTGLFLTNKEALPFHIHTLIRTPNGNDYGKEYIRQYNEQAASRA